MIIKFNVIKASIRSILHHHSSNSFTPKVMFENNSIHSQARCLKEEQLTKGRRTIVSFFNFFNFKIEFVIVCLKMHMFCL